MTDWADLVVSRWIYVDGNATCVATLDDRELRWTRQGSFISDQERAWVPQMLAGRLTQPLDPPELGHVYYRELTPNMRHETTYSPPTDHTATTKPDTPRPQP